MTARAAYLYFGAGEHRLFGWLHAPPPSAAAPTLGVLLCKPFGYEAVCAHRAMRVCAETLAAAGMPVLRFDYRGTGDSADLPAEADQVACWLADIEAAIAALRKFGGVERVCLVGFRLGAMLAALVAASNDAVSGAALVNPIVSGPRYLRELRAHRLAAALGSDATVEPGDSDGIEISGYSLTAATRRTLNRLDLNAELPAACGARLLVIDPSGQPTAQAWVRELQAGGTEVRHVMLPGCVEMLMTDPQFAAVPQKILAALCAWIPDCAQARRPLPRSASVTRTEELKLAGRAPGPRHELTERGVSIDSGVHCFGIVTEPAPGDQRRRAVVLLNVGAENHCGASRMYVTLARRWARLGYTVLRLDLAGLGDSDTRSGRRPDEVFPPAAIADVGAAVAFLRKRYASTDVALGGLCSGAYHALRAAVAGLPVNRLLLVNPMVYYWRDGMTAEDMHQASEIARSLEYYRERIVSGSVVKKLRDGELNLWRVARVLVRRPWVSLAARLRGVARSLNIRLPRDLAGELEDLGARGVQTAFIFSRGEPGLDSLQLNSGASLRRLGDRCRVITVEQADHIFSRSTARSLLEDLLSDELLRRNEASLRIAGPRAASSDEAVPAMLNEVGVAAAKRLD